MLILWSGLKYLWHKEEKQSVERARLEQEAKELNITFEQYQKIVRAANNRNIFRPVFEQMGLGEILSKRGRTKEERNRVNAARQELIERLVEVQQRSEETINIRETINVLYGTDLSVRRGGKAREIKVTNTEMENIVTNAEKEPSPTRRTAQDTIAADLTVLLDKIFLTFMVNLLIYV